MTARDVINDWPTAALVYPRPVLDPAIAEMADVDPAVSCAFCLIPLSQYEGHWCLVDGREVWRPNRSGGST